MLSDQFWHGFGIGVELSTGVALVVGFIALALRKRSATKF
jgi:hypothetical protein